MLPTLSIDLAFTQKNLLPIFCSARKPPKILELMTMHKISWKIWNWFALYIHLRFFENPNAIDINESEFSDFTATTRKFDDAIVAIDLLDKFPHIFKITDWGFAEHLWAFLKCVVPSAKQYVQLGRENFFLKNEDWILLIDTICPFCDSLIPNVFSHGNVNGRSHRIRGFSRLFWNGFDVVSEMD